MTNTQQGSLIFWVKESAMYSIVGPFMGSVRTPSKCLILSIRMR